MGGKRLSAVEKIRRALIKNPNANVQDLAEEFGVKLKTVYNTRYNMRKKLKELAADLQNDPRMPKFSDPVPTLKPKSKWTTVALSMSDKTILGDLINHPPHYVYGGIDTIDFIEAKRLGYHLGNVVKYITRAGRKGTTTGLDDLKKARWYIDRAIEKNEAGPAVR